MGILHLVLVAGVAANAALVTYKGIRMFLVSSFAKVGVSAWVENVSRS